jgi:hydroxymethylbilane synthase
LALVQAYSVQHSLRRVNIDSVIVPFKSEGDINLVSPLYEMNVQGIFTKTLDTALLNHQIDIAVHSLKDVPTQLAEGLVSCAVPARGNHLDLLVYKNDTKESQLQHSIIATSSLRRKAQWLNKYPSAHVENIRGNVETRLRKLDDNHNLTGVIFAAAGLERLNIDTGHTLALDWMVAAPAQGALCIVCRQEDKATISLCSQFTHQDTMVCVAAERQFLRTLYGGCSIPIGCYAKIEGRKMKMEGCILTEDGSQKLSASRIFEATEFATAGVILARDLLHKGAQAIIDTFRSIQC